MARGLPRNAIGMFSGWLNGQPIYNPADLDSLVTILNISDVLPAMPSLSRRRRNEIHRHRDLARDYWRSRDGIDSVKLKQSG